MQYNKAYHCPLKKMINGQLSLKDSASAINTKILFILKDLNMDKNKILIEFELCLS
jgi:hypothetical protein